jgi:asparagine synthase (glutamine-hydrolysing)
LTGICGIVRRDGAPVVEDELVALCDAMEGWGPDGFGMWVGGSAALAQGRCSARTSESGRESLPRYDAESGVAITATGRLDNRAELLAALDVRRAPGGVVPDGDLLAGGYRRWGESAPLRLFGDWALAAWHERERRLLLARDHFGQTALYYVADRERFAFSSSRHALTSLGYVKREVDELYLAQVLISWSAYHGHGTVYRSLRRLPPAHLLTVTPERVLVRRYWDMGDVSELRLRRRADYVEAFRGMFDAAVAARLRSTARVGVTLSGGLDSGSVAVTAAHVADSSAPPMMAFTSVPAYDTEPYSGLGFGNELPFAEATAAAVGIELVKINGASLSPITAIRHALEIHDEPGHAAANQFWILELLAAAQQAGCTTLLTGQLGNAGISWTGWPTWRWVLHQRSVQSVGRLLKMRIRPYLPIAVRRARLARASPPDFRGTAINRRFADRLGLHRRQVAEMWLSSRPLEQRLEILGAGMSIVGALWQECGAAYGLDVRDPCGDSRLLMFVLAIPDDIFTDPATGMDRRLIREAMAGRLPDPVRLNRHRGLQAGDLVPRLRATAHEVDQTLDELATGPAATYLDIVRMRESWRRIQTDDRPEALRAAGSILTRGIMAGLFTNGLA